MIPVRWPDMTALAITYLKTQLADVTVTRTKRDSTSPQIVVAAEPQQLETPISRRVTILLEAWKTMPNGEGDAAGSVALMNDAIFALQQAPDILRQVVRFDQPVGPSIEKDEGKTEYAEGSVVLIISP